MEGLREYKRERAARLYKERRVSIGGAAELAGLTVRERVDYLIKNILLTIFTPRLYLIL